MKNQIIKDALAKHQIRQWKLAEIMKINEFSLSRKLRHELPENEQREIVSLIENYSKQEEERL